MFLFFWLLEHIHMMTHKDRVLCKVEAKNGNKTNYFSRFHDYFALQFRSTISPLHCAGVLWKEVPLLALNKVHDLFHIMKV